MIYKDLLDNEDVNVLTNSKFSNNNEYMDVLKNLGIIKIEEPSKIMVQK